MTSDKVADQQVDISLVANRFACVYYEELHKDPKRTHQFYTSDSRFTRRTENEDVKIAKGQKEIYKILETTSYDKIHVNHVDSQEAPNNGVLIIVTGQMKRTECPYMEDFVQTFFLGSQERLNDGKPRFYVCNDMLQFISREKNGVKQPSKEVKELTSRKTNEETQKKASSAPEIAPKSEKSTEPKTEQQPAHQTEPESKIEAEVVTNEKKGSQVKRSVKNKQAKKAAKGATEENPNVKGVPPESKPEGKKNTKTSTGAKKDTQKVHNITSNGHAEESGTDMGAGESKAANEILAPGKGTGWKTWAERFRVSKSNVGGPLLELSAGPVQSKASATEKSKKSSENQNNEASKPEESGVSPAEGQPGSSMAPRGRGKKGGRGGKSGRYTYNDPEQIAKTLYVNNLPSCDKDDILEKFGEFGKIVSIERPHLAYCFVHYEDKEAVEAALNARPIKLGGEELKVDKRRPSNRSKGLDASRSRGGRARGGRYRHAGRGGDPKVC